MIVIEIRIGYQKDNGIILLLYSKVVCSISEMYKMVTFKETWGRTKINLEHRI